MSTTARSPIPTRAVRPEQAQWPAGQRGPARSARPAGPRPAPMPPPAVMPEPALLQRRKTQHLALTLIVVAAVFSVSMGVLYLSGYASLQFEVNRRVKLQGQLRAARETSKLFQEHMARVNSNEYIEKAATDAHMVPADDRQAVTLDETK